MKFKLKAKAILGAAAVMLGMFAPMFSANAVNTPLHDAIRDGKSDEEIISLAQEHPEWATETDNFGFWPSDWVANEQIMQELPPTYRGVSTLCFYICSGAYCTANCFKSPMGSKDESVRLFEKAMNPEVFGNKMGPNSVRNYLNEKDDRGRTPLDILYGAILCYRNKLFAKIRETKNLAFRFEMYAWPTNPVADRLAGIDILNIMQRRFLILKEMGAELGIVTEEDGNCLAEELKAKTIKDQLDEVLGEHWGDETESDPVEYSDRVYYN